MKGSTNGAHTRPATTRYCGFSLPRQEGTRGWKQRRLWREEQGGEGWIRQYMELPQGDCTWEGSRAEKSDRGPEGWNRGGAMEEAGVSTRGDRNRHAAHTHASKANHS